MENKLKPGINHIEFWVSDLSKSIKFYDDFLSVIGWKQISDVSFSNGSLVIYFIEKKKYYKKSPLESGTYVFRLPKKNMLIRYTTYWQHQIQNLSGARY